MLWVTSPVALLRRALAMLCIAILAATAGTFAGPSQSAAVNLNCGVVVDYECIYLSISGDGTGSVTFTSYKLGANTYPVSLATCQRQGSITSGGCLLGFSYFGISTSITTVDVAMHVTVDSNSCFSYQGGGCGAAYDVTKTMPLQAPTSVVDSDFVFKLKQPEVMHVHLVGTGSGRVTSSPRGINCPSTCSVDFPAGATITLTETPTTGDTFGGWGQACIGTIGGTSCSWTINSTLDINVTFSAPATPPPTSPPTPTPTHAATPRPTTRPTATPKPGSTPGPTKPRASAPAATAAAPTSAPATSAEPGASGGPSAEASLEASTSSPDDQSLPPIATPNVANGEPASTSGSGDLPIVPILAVLLGVLVAGAFLAQRRRKA